MMTKFLVAAAVWLLAAIAPAAAQGDFHIGEVGGNQIPLQIPQTVTAGSAYASGNAVGGLMTLAGAARALGTYAGAPATSGLLQSVFVNSKSLQTTQMDLVLFNANPTTTTCTDKTAIAVSAADFDKVRGVVHITDWTSLGTPSIGQALNLAMPYALINITTMFACLVTRATPTFTAATDISVGFGLLRN